MLLNFKQIVKECFTLEVRSILPHYSSHSKGRHSTLSLDSQEIIIMPQRICVILIFEL